MSEPEMIELECTKEPEVAPGAAIASGMRGEVRIVEFHVTYPECADLGSPEFGEGVAAEVEQWRERQEIAAEWGAALAAVGAFDRLRDDPDWDDEHEV